MLLEPVQNILLPTIPAFNGKKFDTPGFYLGSRFKELFLDKKEPKSTGGSFKVSRLTEPSVDKAITEGLGKGLEVTLGELHHFLEDADKSIWYIAYTKDVQGTLWAVDCYWRSGGGYWYVGAAPVADPDEWVAGYQVFSRDSDGSETQLSDEGSLALSPFDPSKMHITYQGKEYRLTEISPDSNE